MLKLLKLVLFLGIVGGLAGFSVGYVNSLTAPIIEENLIKLEEKNLALMFPEGEFTPIDLTDQEGYIEKAYEVKDTGIVVKFKTRGYNGSSPILALVGFNQDGEIIDVLALSQQETDGFGSRVFDPINIDKLYIGKGLDQEVDLLSGATVTSKGMRAALTSIQATLKERGY